MIDLANKKKVPIESLTEDVKRLSSLKEDISLVLYTSKGLYTDYNTVEILDKSSNFYDITRLYVLDFFNNLTIKNNIEYSTRLDYAKQVLSKVNTGVIKLPNYTETSFRGMTNAEIWNFISKNKLNTWLFRLEDHHVNEDYDLIIPEFKIRSCKILKINEESKYIVCKFNDKFFRAKFFSEQDLHEIKSVDNVRVAYRQIEDRIVSAIYICPA